MNSNNSQRSSDNNEIKSRSYKCARCRVHGEKRSVRNHRRVCPYISCKCRQCEELLEFRLVENGQKAKRFGSNSSRRRILTDSSSFSDSLPTFKELPWRLSKDQTTNCFVPRTTEDIISPDLALLNVKTAQPPMRPLSMLRTSVATNLTSASKNNSLVESYCSDASQLVSLPTFPRSTFQLVCNSPPPNAKSKDPSSTSWRVKLPFNYADNSPLTDKKSFANDNQGTVCSSVDSISKKTGVKKCAECRALALQLVQSTSLPTLNSDSDFGRLADELLDFVSHLFDM